MIVKMGVLFVWTSVAGWGTVIEGERVLDLLWLGEKRGRHVVRVDCEHQRGGWLVTCIVVNGYRHLKRSAKIGRIVRTVVGEGVRKGRRVAGDREVMRGQSCGGGVSTA